MLTSITLFAQGGPQQPGNDPPPTGPIDDNIILLVITGTLFGLYTIYKQKQNKKRPA